MKNFKKADSRMIFKNTIPDLRNLFKELKKDGRLELQGIEDFFQLRYLDDE
jgi:hypothetical protein